MLCQSCSFSARVCCSPFLFWGVWLSLAFFHLGLCSLQPGNLREITMDGRRPANPAFWWINDEGEEVKWSFEELGFLSRKAANILSETCGLQRGDRVLAVLPRVPEWWLLSIACIRTGIVFIPGTSQLTAKDILYRLQASKAKCIITNDTLAPAVESILPDCQFLKAKLIVAKGNRDGWLNLRELFLRHRICNQ
uniref:medium-chain acyl-CoA ligase n=1 Tax=Pavo cristatus TaxID=9049 RepID=A0A8C9FYU3_PAVCR